MKVLIFILLISIPSILYSDIRQKNIADENRGLFLNANTITAYSVLGNNYLDYFNKYSNIFKMMIINKPHFHKNLYFFDIIFYNKIDIFGSKFDLLKLNYTIPITKNILIWWKGNIPGIYRSENKVGLSYSGKFNLSSQGK